MMNLLDTLKDIFTRQATFIAEKDANYKSSWKQRGGIGAFFTIARPWDRFVAIAERENYNLFHIIQREQDAGLDENTDGTLQACIRDLHSYMALLMAEAQQMKAPGSYACTPCPRPQDIIDRYKSVGIDADTVVPPKEETRAAKIEELAKTLKKIVWGASSNRQHANVTLEILNLIK